MECETRNKKKRKTPVSQGGQLKRLKGTSCSEENKELKAGKIKKIRMRNFMCHDALEVELNPNVNFIVGRNGSGKSAILTALTVGLGARANVTSRGASVTGFIKKGKNSASIEVTLVNEGPMAFKPEVYGDAITIIRNISSSSTYKIKDYKGDVISTKRNELDNILQAMNIHIENPITILNQDLSRIFLVASKAEEKYELFMKATLLDVIGNNYKEAEMICEEDYEKLKQYNEILSETRREIDKLKSDIKSAEQIDQFREEVKKLENEMYWANAITQETKLQKIDNHFQQCTNNIKELTDNESSMGTKDIEMNKKIEQLMQEIQQEEQKVAQSAEIYNRTKHECNAKSEEFSTMSREWRSVQQKVKRVELDINMLRKEINQLENGDNAEQHERNIAKQQLAEVERELDEIEAMLRTKMTDKMHFESDKARLQKEINAAGIELKGYDTRIQRIQRELGALKQQSDNALTIFGRNIPRLLRRIEEEYKNKRFTKKPRGPLGAYIKMKDPAWAPAVENFLGAAMFSTFCVDNTRDAKVLNLIIKEIYVNERPPNIICGRFYEKIHDVSAQCTRTQEYSNLLNAMDISDPIVYNCLIDQREVECILLIPTSREAAELMSKASRVPRNCKRAFTQRGDTFYPDPHYRSYGGPRNLRGKFLQVSTRDTINALEEELRAADNEKAVARTAYGHLCEKEKRTSFELVSVNAKVTKLTSAQTRCKTSITDLKDKIQENEAIPITLLKNELNELDNSLQKEKTVEKRLEEEVQKLQKKVEILEAEVKHHREVSLSLNSKIDPLKENIRQLGEEKEAMHAKSRYAAKRLQSANQALQNATAELEIQQRCTEKAVADAERICSRIDTEKSPLELERLCNDLKGKICEIEKQFGTEDRLRKELKEKEKKCGKDFELAVKIENTYNLHRKRLFDRKNLFEDMKRKYSDNIQNSFSNILALRHKKGTITIHHGRKVLELEVNSLNDNRTQTNDTRSLSGGERSYSTVAFILALWDCTGLPFYFLDEFDVFMDKVNRRVIMDILLDHTKSHPESQFTFLTPLGTSNIMAEDYVTIHQLAPPERGS